jgi:hypothetical protein
MNALLLEGLADAIGFLGGVLLAYLLGLAVGFDPLAPGYGGSSIGGIVLAGVGGGVGVQLARRWLRSHRQQAQPED